MCLLEALTEAADTSDVPVMRRQHGLGQSKQSGSPLSMSFASPLCTTVSNLFNTSLLMVAELGL